MSGAGLIHPQALVSADARLGEGVKLGAFAVVGAEVEIGDGTEIGAHAVIEGPTTIGRNNRIASYVSLGSMPQDKKYAGEPTRLSVGDNNTIREFCTINRGTVQDRGETSIGSDNWIMAYVHIAHDCVIGNHTILANNVTMGGHVTIDDWAILGGFSKIHQFCHLGAHCFTQMDCGIGKDVPPYVMAAGMPARPRGINSEGLGRRGFSAEQIHAVKEAYRLLYRSGLRLIEAREALEERAQGESVLAPFVEFFKTSERSIIR